MPDDQSGATAPADAAQPSSRWVERNCENCGAAFTTTRNLVAKGYGKYCSRPCHAKSREKRGADGVPTRFVEQTCLWCSGTFRVDPAVVARGYGLYCSFSCRAKANVGKNNETMRRRAPSTADRLWARVDRSAGPDGCWPWLGKSNVRNYGQMSVGNKSTLAHRIAYGLEKGPIPEGLDVLHKCDNPPCCNPAHLFVGMHRDNMEDKTKKGRQQHGEKHYRAKLTADDVRHIRASGEESAVLAERYGVTQSNICTIRARRSWRSVA